MLEEWSAHRGPQAPWPFRSLSALRKSLHPRRGQLGKARARARVPFPGGGLGLVAIERLDMLKSAADLQERFCEAKALRHCHLSAARSKSFRGLQLESSRAEKVQQELKILTAYLKIPTPKANSFSNMPQHDVYPMKFPVTSTF